MGGGDRAAKPGFRALIWGLPPCLPGLPEMMLLLVRAREAAREPVRENSLCPSAGSLAFDQFSGVASGRLAMASRTRSAETDIRPSDLYGAAPCGSRASVRSAKVQVR